MLTFLTNGSFSGVYVDRDRQVCCKRLTRFAVRPHNPDRELAILLSLRKHKHTNVIELIDHELDRTTEEISLWFPFYELSLMTYVTTMQSPDLSKIVHNLANGLSHLHALGIIHRDVCPNNIVVDIKQNVPRAILLDLGIAYTDAYSAGEARTELLSSVGTGSFRAPELLFGDTNYNESIDLWAFGCTIYQLIHPEHHTLFDAGTGDSELALLASIFRTLGTPSVASWDDASRLAGFLNLNFKDFDPMPWAALLPSGHDTLAMVTQSLLVFNTKDRMRASEISSLLQH